MATRKQATQRDLDDITDVQVQMETLVTVAQTTDVSLEIEEAKKLKMHLQYDIYEQQSQVCYEVITRALPALLAFATIVLLLCVLTYEWELSIIVGVFVAIDWLLLMPLTLMKNIMATSLLMIFLVPYAFLSFALIMIEFINFVKISSQIGANGHVRAACSADYCSGWQAYMFFFFFIALIIHTIILFVVVAYFVLILNLDHVKNKITSGAGGYII
jgi:hypothetical protein